MALLGQKKRDWRVVYAPSSEKTQFTKFPRTSEGMDKSTALNYLAIFNDAVYIEKVRGFRKGRRIYKKHDKRTT